MEDETLFQKIDRKKMKIGILTFHCAHNYGAVLQCYALQETLVSMGHDVEVIDYCPEYLKAPFRVISYSRYHDLTPAAMVKRLIEELVLVPLRIRRNRAFREFIDGKLNLSEKVVERKIPSDYDVYIIGSDQVWNPKLTGGKPEPVYFADFQFDKDGRKYVSYAASMGTVKFPDETAEKSFLDSLVHFDVVSVRETALADFIHEHIPLKPAVVLDPTLLANPEIWDRIAVKPDIDGRYVLVYQVGKSMDAVRLADRIAGRTGAQVIELASWMSPRLSRRKKQCVSPAEFVGLVKYADFVVTTSFHGTAFSLIFGKPFYYVKIGNGVDERSDSLLRILGLEDRMIDGSLEGEAETVDFSGAGSILDEQRKLSLSFLQKTMGE